VCDIQWIFKMHGAKSTYIYLYTAVLSALYYSSPLSASLSNFRFFIYTQEEYWWKLNAVKFHLVLRQWKSLRTPGLRLAGPPAVYVAIHAKSRTGRHNDTTNTTKLWTYTKVSKYPQILTRNAKTVKRNSRRRCRKIPQKSKFKYSPWTQRNITHILSAAIWNLILLILLFLPVYVKTKPFIINYTLLSKVLFTNWCTRKLL